MEDNIYEQLKGLSGDLSKKLNILEEQIDVQLQLTYFKQAKKLKKQIKEEKLDLVLEDVPQLSKEMEPAEIKEQLIKLATFDDPKAYRIIEDYSKNSEGELHNWAVLALQESKMLLESSLLSENQVFISTGLGGKGNSLRYFVVLIGENIEEFEAFQKNLVKSEFYFSLQNNQSELETIEFHGKYITLKVLIPFEVSFQQIFKSTVKECNQYGNFLKENFLVTNVKELSLEEINDFVENNKIPINNDIDIEFEDLDDETED